MVSRGSLRRLLVAVPLVGPPARRLFIWWQASWWRVVRAPLRMQRVRFTNSLKGWMNARRATASNVARRNTRRAYDRLYRDDALLEEYLTPERFTFYRCVAESCVALRPRSVVDVGCGTGHLLKELSEQIELDRIVGVDHSGPGLERAHRLLPHVEFVQSDLYRLRLCGRFDLVVCIEVLEHLSRPAAAVEALVALCAPGGHVVATVPDGAQDTWDGHQNFWTKSEFEEFLGGFGSATVTRIDGGMTLLAVVTPTPQA